MKKLTGSDFLDFLVSNYRDVAAVVAFYTLSNPYAGRRRHYSDITLFAQMELRDSRWFNKLSAGLGIDKDGYFTESDAIIHSLGISLVESARGDMLIKINETEGLPNFIEWVQ